MDARQYLGIALDPLRLSLLGRAAEGDIDVDAIAASHQVPRRHVVAELGKLRSSGLIESDGSLSIAALRDVAQALPSIPSADPELIGHGWTQEEALVLGRFFSGDRLTSIPSARAKRLIVLERFAQEFEPGVRYPEAQVNFQIQLFFADYATIRRYLVDEEFMTRADGMYWRTGGRYRARVP